jgi:hypothetical protein
MRRRKERGATNEQHSNEEPNEGYVPEIFPVLSLSKRHAPFPVMMLSHDWTEHFTHVLTKEKSLHSDKGYQKLCIQKTGLAVSSCTRRTSNITPFTAITYLSTYMLSKCGVSWFHPLPDRSRCRSFKVLAVWPLQSATEKAFDSRDGIGESACGRKFFRSLFVHHS